jgi:anti-anti-sigma factor
MLKVYARNLGNVAVICLQGRIVNGETRSLREAVASQKHVDAIVLDLARVTAIDARGLGVLLELRRQTTAQGINLRLINLNKFTTRVFEVTNLASVFEITSKREPAMSQASSMRLPFAACA